MDVNTNFMGTETTSLVRTPADVLQTAINVDLFTGVVNGWYDAGPYNTINLYLIGGATITAGAVTFECTNDPTNTAGRPLPFRDAESVTSVSGASAVTVTSGFVKLYQIAITARYVRARISTAFTGGATGARIIAEMEVETPSYDLGTQAVAITGTPNVNLTSSTAPTVHTLNSAATTNATSVKATAGRLFSVAVSNQNAAARFVKLYNKASAPTVGTDIPVMVIPLAASSAQVIDFGAFGSQFALGIAYAITGLIADADTTVVTAGDTKVSMMYI
ncbi:hypothetical protein UFOVP149_24 [uncultured Caudovirales phage]|uniref:Uncharacterized protein n=1 Tax=uncultured Caudovirales phage TaxID=2100421 RepID=A0A6J7W7Y0_9CAUD|nr:hypothetical protein UFOVP149_24 [uncultured Caudovirales phage]